LGGAYCSDRFQKIGNAGLLDDEYRNVVHAFRRRLFCWLLIRATAETNQSGYDQ